MFLILFSLVIHFISSCAPIIFYDAVEYHLAAPEAYLSKGGFYFIANNVYTNFPYNIEMLYLIALQSGDEVAAKMINFCFLLLAMSMMYNIARRLKIAPTFSLLVVLLFSAFKITNDLMLYCYIETGIIFFVSVFFYLLLAWQEAPNKKTLLFLAIISGIILGCKYTTIIIFFIPIIFILAILIFHR